MIIAVLVAGNLLAGNVASRAADTNQPPSTPPAEHKGPGGPGGPGSGPGGPGFFEHMAQELDLTAEQKPKVQAIMDSVRQKSMELRQDTSLSPEDRTAKRKAIREEQVTQMKAVLTPEQFEKWQKMPPPGRGSRNGPNGPRPDGGKAGGTNAPAGPPKE